MEAGKEASDCDMESEEKSASGADPTQKPSKASSLNEEDSGIGINLDSSPLSHSEVASSSNKSPTLSPSAAGQSSKESLPSSVDSYVDAANKVEHLSLAGAAESGDEDINVEKDITMMSASGDKPAVSLNIVKSSELDSDDASNPDSDNDIIPLSSITGMVDSSNPSPCGGGSPSNKRSISENEASPQAKRQTPDGPNDDDSNDEVSNSLNISTSQEEPSSSGAVPPEDLSSASTTDDDDDEAVPMELPSRVSSYLRRRRRRNRSHHSDSSSNSSSSNNHSDSVNVTLEESQNDSDDDDAASGEEVKKAVSAIMDKTPPKPTWFFVPELKRREYGFSRRESLYRFNERLQGSLEMVKRLSMVDEMKYHERCVNALSFNRIGTLLASGSDDLDIVLWNWQKGRPAMIYDSGHRSSVFQAKFMPFSGDCHVISCARDGQVRLAELSLTGLCKATRKLANHRGSAHKLALEMDSPNNFLSCGEDAVTFLIDLRENKPHRLVTTKENDKKVPLYSIHSNPCNPEQFCVGGRDHFIRVYDKRKISEDIDGGVLKKLCPDHLINSDIKANVTCACYNYNGTEILGTYNDEDIYLFDNTMSDGANYTHRYKGHRNFATVKGVNFYGPRSEFIVSGSDCGNVYFWDKSTEAIVNFQAGDEAGVINVLEPHPLLPILATSGLDHEVKLWMPSHDPPGINKVKLKETVQKNHVGRCKERSSEPEMVEREMLWFHLAHVARRRMRAEGINVSSSDTEYESNSDGEEATNDTQCAQS